MLSVHKSYTCMHVDIKMIALHIFNNWYEILCNNYIFVSVWYHWLPCNFIDFCQTSFIFVECHWIVGLAAWYCTSYIVHAESQSCWAIYCLDEWSWFCLISVSQLHGAIPTPSCMLGRNCNALCAVRRVKLVLSRHCGPIARCYTDSKVYAGS